MLTLALMYQLAQFESLRWLAVFISNDGQPFPDVGADQVVAAPESGVMRAAARFSPE